MQGILSLVQPDALGAQLLMRPFAVTGLVSLMSPQHLAAVTAWQDPSQDGSHSAQTMLSLVAAILHNPFLPGGASEVLVKDLQEVSAGSHVLVRSSVNCVVPASCKQQKVHAARPLPARISPDNH